MKEKRLALPLTRTEEALGSDNMCTVKALPPTSWYLTTVKKKKEKRKPRPDELIFYCTRYIVLLWTRYKVLFWTLAYDLLQQNDHIGTSIFSKAFILQIQQ